jgi:hypothetical protein
VLAGGGVGEGHEGRKASESAAFLVSALAMPRQPLTTR